MPDVGAAAVAAAAAAGMDTNEAADKDSSPPDNKDGEGTPAVDDTLNVDKYSVEDLLEILHLNDPTVFQVKDAINTLIARMRSSGRKDVMAFFEKAQDKILHQIQPTSIPANSEVFPRQMPIDAIWGQQAMHPEGDEKTTYFDDNTHFAANQQGGGGGDGGGGPPPPDIVVNRIVCIDSQFRQDILPYYGNSSFSPTLITHFNFNLANPINNTVAMTLYSYSIPTTFYAFNSQVGNTFFQYNGIIISIPDGNYTLAQLISTINTLAALNLASSGLVVSGPDPITGRITFTNTDPLTTNVTVVLYVQNNTTNVYSCGNQLASLFQTVGINNTLGWTLGFRTTPDATTGDVYFTINSGESVISDVQPDVYGPKYFILNVEDFSGQGLTSGLTGITNTKTSVAGSVSDYYRTRSTACLLQGGNLTKAQLLSINAVQQDTAPATFSAAKIFANKMQAPSSSSAFAFIPLANVPVLRSQGNMPIVAFGANAIVFSRKYGGPIRLERMTVSLVDDKGNFVNLNDNNWNFSLIVSEKVN